MLLLWKVDLAVFYFVMSSPEIGRMHRFITAESRHVPFKVLNG
jgi:hypothetical protein